MKDKVLQRKLLKTLVPIIAIGALILAGYFYSELRMLRKNPQAAAQNEAADTIAKVGRLVVLPNETPTIATVADPAALKEQPFFASAQKGDKVLIYATAKKAILYSVTLNKVIDMAPLNIGTQKGGVTAPKAPAVTPEATPAPTPSTP